MSTFAQVFNRDLLFLQMLNEGGDKLSFFGGYRPPQRSQRPIKFADKGRRVTTMRKLTCTCIP